MLRAHALPAAKASATTLRIGATASVIRIPVATASGRAVVMSLVADASANTAPITDTPVIRPRLRDRLNSTSPEETGALVKTIGEKDLGPVRA